MCAHRTPASPAPTTAIRGAPRDAVARVTLLAGLTESATPAANPAPPANSSRRVRPCDPPASARAPASCCCVAAPSSSSSTIPRRSDSACAANIRRIRSAPEERGRLPLRGLTRRAPLSRYRCRTASALIASLRADVSSGNHPCTALCWTLRRQLRRRNGGQDLSGGTNSSGRRHGVDAGSLLSPIACPIRAATRISSRHRRSASPNKSWFAPTTRRKRKLESGSARIHESGVSSGRGTRRVRPAQSTRMRVRPTGSQRVRTRGPPLPPA